MGTLFLASVGGKVLDKIVPYLGKSPSQLVVAFVPTAADPYEDKWFIREDREALTGLGFQVFDLDLKNKTGKEIKAELKKADVVFVAGGNIFYLLEKSNVSGFAEAVWDFVDQGKAYIGSSAGSVLAGPEVKPLDVFDDPKEAPNLKSTKGLNLAPVIILPHFGDPDELDIFQAVIDKWKEKYNFVKITNEQLLFVKDGKWVVL